MDPGKAAELIEQHRRHWKSSQSDEVIARRAERLYLKTAMGFGLTAVGNAIADAVHGRLASWWLGLIVALLAVAVLFYWQSRRLSRIRKMLSDRRHETALFIFVAVIVVGSVAYFLLFPRNAFISFYTKPGGGWLVFSRTSIAYQSAPDRYATNGFNHIDAYLTRLLVPTNRFKYLSMFTPDGTRGFGLDAKDGIVTASLTVEWRQEGQREATIRSFFNSFGVIPSRDYLAGNGGVPDATRVLEYPVRGNAGEVTALTKRILQELCGVAPTEALNIEYREK